MTLSRLSGRGPHTSPYFHPSINMCADVDMSKMMYNALSYNSCTLVEKRILCEYLMNDK
jgi:hypothetical protein